MTILNFSYKSGQKKLPNTLKYKLKLAKMKWKLNRLTSRNAKLRKNENWKFKSNHVYQYRVANVYVY
jgi:hypothetical protein